MTVDKEADLVLSLSLNMTQHKTEKQQQEHQLQHKQQEYQNQMQAQNVNINNLFPSFFNSTLQHYKVTRSLFTSGVDHTHTSSMMRPSAETRTLQKAIIGVNRLPITEDYTAHDAGASSPKSTISSQSGKRSEREPDHPASSGSDDEDGDNSRKKLRLSKDQSAILEETFKDHNTLNPKQKMALAKQLGLRPRQVEVWFQNRRARTKLKQTEVDCEFLKQCCENLTEENRRLQKEVQELRALKLSPQFYMQMAPPTTLTMCTSCERVGGHSQSNQSGRPKSRENHWTVATRSFDAGIRPLGATLPVATFEQAQLPEKLLLENRSSLLFSFSCL